MKCYRQILNKSWDQELRKAFSYQPGGWATTGRQIIGLGGQKPPTTIVRVLRCSGTTCKIKYENIVWYNLYICRTYYFMKMKGCCYFKSRNPLKNMLFESILINPTRWLRFASNGKSHPRKVVAARDLSSGGN